MLSLQEELKKIEIEEVIDDDLKFKYKLGMGEEAYTYLKNTRNLIEFLEVIGSGGCAAFGTYTTWAASLGFWGHLGLSVGLVSSPIGWIVGSGILGAFTNIWFKKFFRKVRQKTMIEIPKFINRPLDILGKHIAELLVPIGVKIAVCDGEFAESEQKSLVDYFHKRWGFNKDYIIKLVSKIKANINKYNYYQLKQDLKQLSTHNKELKYDIIINEILNIAEEIANADGIFRDQEKQELFRLKSILVDA